MGFFLYADKQDDNNIHPFKNERTKHFETGRML